MVRSLNQIEQEMAALQQTVASIAEEFHEVYGQYLDALGQAVRQQLILACYHLCTHGYPDAFLGLPFNQRQELQQMLRKLAQKAETEMTKQLQPIVPRNLADEAEEEIEEDDLEEDENEADENDEADEEIDLAESLRNSAANLGLSSGLSEMDLPTALRFIQMAMEPQNSESGDKSDNELDSELDSEPDDESDNELDNEPDNELDNEPDNELDDKQVSEPPIEDRPLTPKDLLYWQDTLEESVIDTLHEVSHAANRLLHKTGVLPRQMPAPILEVATKAELSAEATASPPNLLSLMIETRSESSKRPTMTTIIVVRLRLSEIEFASGSLGVWRSRIRELSARFSKLGRDYYQKQKERSIAQAEAAWRSSWYED